MARHPHPSLSPDEINAILRALADPRRFDVIRQLAAADAPVPCCALDQAGQVTPSTMTHHLQLLEQSGLIDLSREGKYAVLHFNRARYDAFLHQLASDTRPAPLP